MRGGSTLFGMYTRRATHVAFLPTAAPKIGVWARRGLMWGRGAYPVHGVRPHPRTHCSLLAPSPARASSIRRHQNAHKVLAQTLQQTVVAAPTPTAAPTTALSLSIRNSPGLQSVAELATAWSQVARRLPQRSDEAAAGITTGCGPDGEALIISALKLALACLHGAPPRPDGRPPLARATDLAAVLADLSAAGIPLDAEAIAAGILVEAVEHGGLDMGSIQERCGPGVAALVHDVLRIRTAGLRVELYDDVASSAIREWCLAMHDVRANVLEVVSRWDDLQHMFSLPYSDQQILALEALQLFAPLGHALGLGAVSSRVEDLCFKVLFPASYTHTSEWLHDVADVAEDALFACQQQLLVALDDHPRFKHLAAGCMVRARTKSLFSIMKKLLRLEDLSKGGRAKEEIFDVLGMRAIVQPLPHLPPAQAEAFASEACYIVKEVAEHLWPQVPGRSKDYISQPKRNGYQSLHLTMQLLPPPAPLASTTKPRTTGGDDGGFTRPNQQPVDAGEGRQAEASTSGRGSVGSNREGGRKRGRGASGPGSGKPGRKLSASEMPVFELQIRTQLMDELAEAGDASHASYKGGLDSRQARQLREWTEQLRQRLALRPNGQLLLPAPADFSQGSAAGGARSRALEPQEVSLAAQALFSNWDQDGNGELSLDELRDQLREIGGGIAEAEAEVLMSFLAEEEAGASGSSMDGADPASQGSGGQRGISMDQFSKFVEKVSLVAALDRLDKQQAQDLLSGDTGS